MLSGVSTDQNERLHYEQSNNDVRELQDLSRRYSIRIKEKLNNDRNLVGALSDDFPIAEQPLCPLQPTTYAEYREGNRNPSGLYRDFKQGSLLPLHLTNYVYVV